MALLVLSRPKKVNFDKEIQFSFKFRSRKEEILGIKSEWHCVKGSVPIAKAPWKWVFLKNWRERCGFAIP